MQRAQSCSFPRKAGSKIMRAAGGSKRAAGAVEASLKQAAAASEEPPSGDTRAHAEAKRPRVLERAPSLKTASSVKIGRAHV